MLVAALSLAASLSFGSGDFLAGLMARRTSLWTVFIVSQLAGAASAGLVVLLRGHAPGVEVVLPGLGAGLLSVAAIVMSYKALTIGVMSIVGPIFGLAAAVPLLVGLARGERPGALQAVGIAVALAGVLLAARAKSAGRHRRTGGLSIVLAVLTAVAYGLVLVLYAGAAESDPYWGAFLSRVASLSVFSLAFAALRPALRLSRRAALPIIAGGILSTGGNVLFSVASTLGYLSIVSVTTSVYPAFTAVLAYIVLHERLARPQLAGVALALLGVALLSVG